MTMIGAFIAVCALLLTTGCPRPKPPETEPPVPPPPPPITETTPPSAQEPSLRGGEFQSVPQLQPVLFSFDRYSLDDEARTVADRNAEFLLSRPELEVLIEGHTCEMGTNEYNLGLGQKRATVLREYYIQLGIPANRIATISYGEEKPVNPGCMSATDPACAQNRRAVTLVRAR
jgi:peptidoglycan-associated lipoprotein